MEKQKSPLIDPLDLVREKAANPIILVDARGGPDAHNKYLQGHLEDAFFLDLDKDLSSPTTNPARGGRHPLPDVQDFGKTLGKLGITPASKVVVYDDKAGANAAARFWWMLKAIGHQHIQVVNGGLDSLKKYKLPITDSISMFPTTSLPYPVNNWLLPVVDIEFIDKIKNDPEYLVIDVRENYRYKGESEPIDLVAGHIPGAINLPYLNNLNAEGLFRSDDELKQLYEEAIGTRDPRNVSVHCGSGVTACHTLLALEEAGIYHTNLYVGSWSEWSRNDRQMC